jgi:hypothetical protein
VLRLSVLTGLCTLIGAGTGAWADDTNYVLGMFDPRKPTDPEFIRGFETWGWPSSGHVDIAVNDLDRATDGDGKDELAVSWNGMNNDVNVKVYEMNADLKLIPKGACRA